MQRTHSLGAPAARRLSLGALVAVVLLSLVVPASHADERPDMASPGADGVKASTAQRACIRGGNLIGVASAAGKPVTGATVRVYARSKAGTYARELTKDKPARTNRQGGFSLSVECLPRDVLVSVTGGRRDGSAFRQTMLGLGRISERGIVVSPATTIVAQYAKQHPAMNPAAATHRVRAFLEVVDLGSSLTDFGFASLGESRTFSAAKYLRVAMRNGGVLRFSAEVARDVKAGSGRSFKPKNYVSPRKTPVTSGQAQPRLTSTDVVTNTLSGVASSALYGGFCTLTAPTPVGSFACPVDTTNAELVQISDQLTAISNQLTELQQSITEIQDTLNAMEIQLSDIEAQNEDIIQLTLQQQAIAAAQNYQAAYEAAGVQQITQLVKAAGQDIYLLNATAPLEASSWEVVPAGSTPAQQCAAVYQNTIAPNDQDPFSLCTDYLTQVDAFANPANAYYDTLYNGIVGGASAPTDNLLLWTNQQAITQGANAPVSQSTVASMQEFGFQLEQLLSNAYAMYAAGQMFTYYLTTDEQAICTNIQTSGLWPANTVISVADPCNTINSGLFAMSVQEAQAQSLALPPADTVVDPRTNYIWWRYPVDITYTWRESATDPFYPGAPSGTYQLDTFNKYGLFTWSATNAAESEGLPLAYPLLAQNPQMTFWYASQSQLEQLFSNMLLVQGATVAESMVNQGFAGVGTTANGMDWTNIGADVNWQTWGQVSTLKWQSTESIAPAKGCTGYPGPFPASGETAGYDFSCLIWYGSSASEFSGTFATSAWNLDTTSLPSSANVQPCQTVGTVLNQDGNTSTPATLCWTDTFTLMVDADVQSPQATSACDDTTESCAARPALWATYMLSGPSPKGVPAVTPVVPQV